jgi:hypothetical protein
MGGIQSAVSILQLTMGWRKGAALPKASHQRVGLDRRAGLLGAEQAQILGHEDAGIFPHFVLNAVVRWWLGELLLEAGRPRDAERYFKSLTAYPFAALRSWRAREGSGVL